VRIQVTCTTFVQRCDNPIQPSWQPLATVEKCRIYAAFGHQKSPAIGNHLPITRLKTYAMYCKSLLTCHTHDMYIYVRIWAHTYGNWYP